ncbi:hypothetical protein [Crenobacter cavernae]|uniref:hypothetical protein n=1 Tax=Crenobacter cavernae TaxID=2290923 RepID=UPI0015F18461|nr:hypothetical protein [Crenobacter cavernae]
MLLSPQRDDVLKAEIRLMVNSENGMLFTNGTGTGKTFVGLGVARCCHGSTACCTDGFA